MVVLLVSLVLYCLLFVAVGWIFRTRVTMALVVPVVLGFSALFVALSIQSVVSAIVAGLLGSYSPSNPRDGLMFGFIDAICQLGAKFLTIFAATKLVSKARISDIGLAVGCGFALSELAIVSSAASPLHHTVLVRVLERVAALLFNVASCLILVSAVYIGILRERLILVIAYQTIVDGLVAAVSRFPVWIPVYEWGQVGAGIVLLGLAVWWIRRSPLVDPLKRS
ncbi:MAG: hypothetical protein OWS03_07860 [Alicyclobacillaceae bacterium]|nr:hypothetical protein [Alicyclobacillaceae bacterium]